MRFPLNNLQLFVKKCGFPGQLRYYGPLQTTTREHSVLVKLNCLGVINGWIDFCTVKDILFWVWRILWIYCLHNFDEITRPYFFLFVNKFKNVWPYFQLVFDGICNFSNFCRWWGIQIIYSQKRISLDIVCWDDFE